MRQKSKEQTSKQLGAAIKRCRIERGMSRKDLQEATGRSYPYLSEIEAGKKAPSTEVLGEIAAALGMEMHELIETAEKGREPRGWVAPRESHFHRSAKSMDSPVLASMASTPPPEDFAFPSVDESSYPDDPIAELIRLAQELPDQDLAMLLDLARRLGG